MKQGNGSECRRINVAIVAALSVGALTAALLLARPAPLAAQGSAPPPGALEQLERAQQELIESVDKGPSSNKWRTDLGEATEGKFRFVSEAFGGQRILGCSAAELLFTADYVDSNLARADESTERGAGLENAHRHAQDLLDRVEKRCSDAGDRERGIAKDIEKRTKRLSVLATHDKLSGKERERDLREIAAAKRDLFFGQEVYGCEVVEFHTLIDRIDALIARAGAVEGKDPKDNRRRRTLVGDALEAVTTLIEKWKLVPCGEDGGQPPPPSFTVLDHLSWWHVNGFGTPPTRECNFVATEPAQPGAGVVDVITGPNPSTPDPNDTSQVTKTATADDSGFAVVSQEITATGTYTHQTTVTSQTGAKATDTESQTVTAAPMGANGACPPPTP